MADLRVRRSAHAPGAARLADPPALPRALAVGGQGRHRVPALGRLRKRSTSRSRRDASTSSRLAPASGSGRGTSTTAWLRRRRSATASSTRGSWIACRAGKHEAGARGFVIAWDARQRAPALAIRRGRRSSRRRCSSATRSTSAPGTTSSTRSRCGGGSVRGALDVRGRRPGRRGACVRGRDGLHRHEQRERLRGQRAERPDALARDLVLALRAARVLLRDADRRLRARLRRQRGRHGLRLRRLDRTSALGPRVGTYVYTAAAVWRKTVYVGTWDGIFSALDARTGDVRWRYERSALDHRRADGSRRPRLLRDLRPLRVGGLRRARSARAGPSPSTRGTGGSSGGFTTASTRPSSPTAGGSTSSGGATSTPSSRRFAGAGEGGSGEGEARSKPRAATRARSRSAATRGTRSGRPG